MEDERMERAETSLPKLGLYVAAATAAVVLAAIASTHGSDEGGEAAAPAMLTVAEAPPAAAHGFVFDPLASPAIDAAPSPAAPATPVAAPAAPPLVAAAAPKDHPLVVARVPPKPVARPAAPKEKAPAAVPAEAAIEATAVDLDPAPSGPVPPMPIVADANVPAAGSPGLIARSGRLVGSVWSWSGRTVGGVVREVRSLAHPGEDPAVGG
jgi:hypothetical protein